MTGPAALAAAAAALGLLGADVTSTREGTQPPTSLARPWTSEPRSGDPLQVSRRWQWPVHPRPAVVRPFMAPVSAYGAGHRGLDLAASEGMAVLAVEAGVIVHAGVVAGRGTVSVEHADGLRSTYEPVTASMRVGDVVAAGEQLGTITPGRGAAHCGPTGCLHLGARRGETYLDPRPLLAGGRVILLPFL